MLTLICNFEIKGERILPNHDCDITVAHVDKVLCSDLGTANIINRDR